MPNGYGITSQEPAGRQTIGQVEHGRNVDRGTDSAATCGTKRLRSQ